MSLTFPIGQRFLPTLPSEPKLPSTPRAAMNFVGAQIRSVVSQSRGNPRKVTDATRDARRAVCKSNTCGFYRATDGRCAHKRCGCPVSRRGIIESKTELFSEYCPAIPSLWGPGELAGQTQPQNPI